MFHCWNGCIQWLSAPPEPAATPGAQAGTMPKPDNQFVNRAKKILANPALLANRNSPVTASYRFDCLLLISL
jgi:hypothetical protein